ncbi:MAG: glycoside hydrolase family 97 N-terminal domain-containing protein, partial [Bacteroidota bacterium]
AIELASPDGVLHFSFQATDSGLYYNVTYRETKIIQRSPLSLTFQGTGEFGKNCLTQPPLYRQGEDNYELVVGKTRSVHDFYREVEIPLEERAGQHRRVNILVRLFNDGLAFRYLLPQQPNWSSYNLTDENTCFRFIGDPFVLASFLPGYTTSHEGRYTRVPFSKAPHDTLMDMPVLMEFGGEGGHVYVAVTEAELVDYAGMYLVRHGDCLKSELSPLPGQPSSQVPAGRASQVADRSSLKVRASLPHRTPWRVLLISDRPGSLLESNILTSLNEPCALKDVSWIRPGKTDFHWWNGDIVPDTTFSPGINFETNQYYIDFCARNGLAYHSIIGFGGVAWYRNDGVSYMPGPNSDVTHPVPGLDIKQLSDYAEKKGVGIRVWVHWKALYPMIDKAF